MRKIVAVAGDVTLAGFGLSAADLQLIQDNVSIVFNSAATVKFDEELKTAVQLNVKGPRELLAICRKMKKLEVRVSVCTRECVSSTTMTCLAKLASHTCFYRFFSLSLFFVSSGFGPCLDSFQ